MIAVPFIATAVASLCKTRYLPIFVLATFGVCMAVSAWNFVSTLFYLLPSLLTGTLYGLLWKKGVPAPINLFLASVVQFLAFLGTLELIKVLCDGFDMANFLLALVGRGDDSVARLIFPAFAYGYSLAQMAISELFLTIWMERLGKAENKEGFVKRLYPAFATLFLCIAVPIAFASISWGYVLLCLGLFWSVFSYMNFPPKIYPLTCLVLGVSLFASLLLFAFLYSKMPNQTGLILLAIPFGLSDFCVALNDFCREKETKKTQANS